MSTPSRPGHDAAVWDDRYANTDRLWSATPNATVATLVGDLPAGRALDVAAGEGRHAVWLAGRGWDVTAVDFSAVGIARGRAGAADSDVPVDWVVADVTTWAPPADTSYDLILVAYLHVPEDVFGRLREWLAPGGRLVVVGHALRNLTEGVGGPQNPQLLYDEEKLQAAAAGLRVERLGEVFRETPDGTAIDVCLVATDPRSV
ncbi:MAG: methyltransferase domain-containing protein [Streptosporangiales bacterium]|nr:methyltransferase domain-containing protein [Streptosporangiales bacterium]